MLPVVTVIGLEFAFLIGGLVVTEQVFNLNGIGKLFVQAVTRSDFTMVQALVLLVADVFHHRQFRDRPAVRLARSAHPVPLMSAVPAPIEITYKVPKRRHPVLAFVAAAAARHRRAGGHRADDPRRSVRAAGWRRTTR